MFLSPGMPIRVEAAGNEVTYFLPARPLGKLRFIGVVLIAFTLVPLSVEVSFFSSFWSHIFKGQAEIFHWIFGAFVLLFVLATLVPAMIGVLVLAGRCRVEWREQRLTVVDYFGPIRWKRRLQKSAVRQLVVSASDATVNGQRGTTGVLANVGGLNAELEEGGSRIIAVGYPKDWLETLSRDLAARMGTTVAFIVGPRAQAGARAATAYPPERPGSVLIERTQPEVGGQVVQKPANTKVRLEPTSTGLQIIVPPAGIWKGSRGLIYVGIFWCLFMVPFSWAFLFSKGRHGADVEIVLFLLLFWVIGICLLLGAINMGRRRALLLVDNGELRIAQESLFGKKLWHWQAGDIAAIRTDASGMTVNNRPVINLQVHSVQGQKVGLFAGRDEQELNWIAGELRRVLNVPIYDK